MTHSRKKALFLLRQMDKIHTGTVKQKHLIKQRNSLTIQEKKNQKHTHVKYQMAL